MNNVTMLSSLGVLLALLVPASGFSLSADAQPADPGTHAFFPLEMGNVWIHQYATDTPAYRTMEVVGSDVLNGEPVWLLEIAFMPFDDSTGPSGTCAVRITPNEELIVTPLDADPEVCDLFYTGPDHIPDLASGADHSREKFISGHSLTLTVREFWGFGAAHLVFAGENLGPLTVFRDHSTAALKYPRVHLVYANIAGVEYGKLPNEFDWSRFFPVQVGNEWVWHEEFNSAHSSFERYIHYNIISASPNYRQDSFTIRARTLSMEGIQLTSSQCSYEMTSDGRAVSACQTYPIPIPDNALSFKHFGTMQPHDNNQDRYLNLFYYNHSGAHDEQRWVSGLGMTSRRTGNSEGPGSSLHSYERNLVWALIDGEEYGSLPPVVSTEESGSDAGLSVSIYPNPLSRDGTVVLRTPGTGGSVSADVIDLLGRVVIQFDVVTHPEDSVTLTLEGAGLAPGVYVLRVSSEHESVSQTFTVVR